MREIWKNIEGYEGLYKISTFGNAKSLDRYEFHSIGHIRFRKGKSLSLYTDKDGYKYIVLCKNSKAKSYKLSRIVAKTFIKGYAKGLVVNHKKDGNKNNNMITNLEWVTIRQNNIHALNNKLRINVKGENHCCAKLTNKEVVEIKKSLLLGNCTQTSLAKKYNINPSQIYSIKHNKTWKHIKIK